MKFRGLFFLLLPCLFLFSCLNEPNDKSTKTITTPHEYPDTKPKQLVDKPPVGLEEEENLYTLYRDLWQNPIEVIQQMGNLEGKTVADIGAGPFGYFSIQIAARSNAEKILALDIDPKAITYIKDASKLLPNEIGDKIETRLVAPDDPQLKPGEADIALVVNTAPYFEDRVAYFRTLMKGLAPGGRVVVIDFKRRYSLGAGPPIDSRVPLGDMEQDLRSAGYSNIKSDDRTLEYQYIIIAGK